MPRVNVEEKCFDTDLPMISALTGWDQHFCLGCLCFLWHTSQKFDCEKANKEEIKKWTKLFDNKKTDIFIKSGLESGFLEPINDEIFYIKGNREQLSWKKYRSKQCSEAGKKGMEKRWGKYNEPITDDNGVITGITSSTSTSTSTRTNNKDISSCKIDNELITDVMVPSDKPKGREIKKPKKEIIISDSEKLLAQKWFEYALSLTPNGKFKIDSFQSDIVKAKKEIKLNDKGMDEIFEVMKTDNFWKDKIRTPKALLKECSDGLRKIDHLIDVLKRTKYKTSPINDWAKNKTEELEREGITFDKP